jgi:hypothetical protein
MLILAVCISLAFAVAATRWQHAQPAAPNQPAPVVQPTPARPAVTNYGDYELFTLPAPENTILQVQPGQLAAVWWKVSSIDGNSYKDDCSGVWLQPGTYTITAAGRIRVWQGIPEEELPKFKTWWQGLVQQEADAAATSTWSCTYQWYER